MHCIETRPSRNLAIAATVTIAVLGCAGFLGTAGRSDASAQGTPGRSAQATAVEAQMARADLVGAMEAALGRKFAGVWFEPSTARVHVDFTSSAARKAVEGVAAKIGLARYVIPTPARSTWAQLSAAQEPLRSS
jgi:hypothetical protein